MADCPNKAEFNAMFKKMPKGAQERLDGALADYHQECNEDSSDGEDQPRMGSLQRISAIGKYEDSSAKKSNGLMYVDLMVNGKQARALIDSGASHNFVTKEEADRLGLVLRDANSASVNGKMRRVQGVAKKVAVQLGEWAGELEFTTVPLDDFKIVLGMQFFQKALVVLKPSDGSMLTNGSIVVNTVDGDEDKGQHRISAMRVIPTPKQGMRPWRMPKGSVEPRANKTQANYDAKWPGGRKKSLPPHRGVDNEGRNAQRNRPRTIEGRVDILNRRPLMRVDRPKREGLVPSWGRVRNADLASGELTYP
ncbi:uncharacterized protein LOC141610956 [Silene latifolia]|uniref:uncharacterized protein LOC141610956 n=1 Tax=Silene latifolia TaxID=37657 RepID=UPI003D7823BC